MSGDKSYVGMGLCFYCGEPKGVVLDRRMRDTLPREAVYDREPCNECKEHMRAGIMLIECPDGESGDNPKRTGRMCVVREEAIRRIMRAGEHTEAVCRKRATFVEAAVWTKLGLPRGDQQETPNGLQQSEGS